MLSYMSIIWCVFGGVLGGLIASALQCMLQRSVLADDSWFTGRSKCDHCGATIPITQNIPVITYLHQKGKSKCCNKLLTPIYLLCECAGVSMGVAAACMYIMYGQISLILVVQWTLLLILLFAIVGHACIGAQPQTLLIVGLGLSLTLRLFEGLGLVSVLVAVGITAVFAMILAAKSYDWCSWVNLLFVLLAVTYFGILRTVIFVSFGWFILKGIQLLPCVAIQRLLVSEDDPLAIRAGIEFHLSLGLGTILLSLSLAS